MKNSRFFHYLILHYSNEIFLHFSLSFHFSFIESFSSFHCKNFIQDYGFFAIWQYTWLYPKHSKTRPNYVPQAPGHLKFFQKCTHYVLYVTGFINLYLTELRWFRFLLYVFNVIFLIKSRLLKKKTLLY